MLGIKESHNETLRVLRDKIFFSEQKSSDSRIYFYKYLCKIKMNSLSNSV